ncbi:transposase [Lewinella sp. W8]|uniref:transposase n=1 Tax=Lewinella sp. W8 TaxID=2528208 RepID=UPI001067DA5F|nr:transposase [Lewinella sp. W8]MTB51694.1 hypothetical protein [Lewinella sp. W8]
MPRKQGQDVIQYGLFATPLEEMIASDNEVWVIKAFVDQLDLADLGFVQVKSQGRSRYASDVLLKIYLYGYLNGIRSSRKLEKACRVNIELMWLTGRLEPAYHTIADFRKDHPQALKNVFRQYPLLLKDWEMLGLETFAIDGTKIRAQNSMKRNFNRKKFKRHLDRIDVQIEQALQDWEAADEKTQQETRPAVDKLLKKLDERRLGYERLDQTLEDSGETQIRLTDPDTRSLPLHRNIVEVGYNVQQVLDDKDNLIVAHEVTNESDINALGDLAVDSCNALGLYREDSIIVLTDKGYHNGGELQYCQENNISTLVAERKPFNFLSNLNIGIIEGVKYTVVAGNLDQYLNNTLSGKGLLDKLYKLGGELFSRGVPNGIALGVERMKLFPDLSMPGTVSDADAHYINYYDERSSLKVIMNYLTNA